MDAYNRAEAAILPLFATAWRADSFLKAGDIDGTAVWKRVLKAIGEIQRQQPQEGEAVN